tara:strand:+ start:1377 stop:2591 length:1215 start_codon:yes stop_codon:yes gene_type:complete
MNDVERGNISPHGLSREELASLNSYFSVMQSVLLESSFRFKRLVGEPSASGNRFRSGVFIDLATKIFDANSENYSIRDDTHIPFIYDFYSNTYASQREGAEGFTQYSALEYAQSLKDFADTIHVSDDNLVLRCVKEEHFRLSVFLLANCKVMQSKDIYVTIQPGPANIMINCIKQSLLGYEIKHYRDFDYPGLLLNVNGHEFRFNTGGAQDCAHKINDETFHDEDSLYKFLKRYHIEFNEASFDNHRETPNESTPASYLSESLMAGSVEEDVSQIKSQSLFEQDNAPYESIFKSDHEIMDVLDALEQLIEPASNRFTRANVTISKSKKWELLEALKPLESAYGPSSDAYDCILDVKTALNLVQSKEIKTNNMRTIKSAAKKLQELSEKVCRLREVLRHSHDLRR